MFIASEFSVPAVLSDSYF